MLEKKYRTEKTISTMSPPNFWNIRVTIIGPTKLLKPDPKFKTDTAVDLSFGIIAGIKAESGPNAATPKANSVKEHSINI